MPAPSRTRDVHPSLLLTIFAAATFMTALDVFIVNVALPTLAVDVGHVALNDLSWVLNGYTIVFAALLVPAGRLGDRYGNKGVFILGLVVFSLASLGCALSSSLWLIVGLRCLQGAGGAALLPTSLGLILTTIPQQRRHHAIRIWAIVGSFGAAAGPAVGGLLVAASWRWIFIINVPIGAIAALLAARFVPDVRHNHDTHVPDLIGGAFLILALGTHALGLVEGPVWGWSSTKTIASLVIAAISAVAFVLRSLWAKAPVVDLRLFRTRIFAWSNGAMFFSNVGFGIQLLGLILWMQYGWHWSALQTGLAIAPGPVAVSITALVLRPQLPKLPEGVLAAVGVLLMAGGGILIGTSISAQPNYAADVLPGWLIVGAGVGLALPSITAAGASSLAAHQTGTGSGVLQMARWIGSTIGVSLLVVVLGRSTGVGTSATNFAHAWWWAARPQRVAAVLCLGITPRPATTLSAVGASE